MSDSDYLRVYKHSEAEHYAQYHNAEAAQKYITSNFKNREGKPLVAKKWWPEFFKAWFDPAVDVICLVADRQEGKSTAVIGGAMKYEMVQFFDRSFGIAANSVAQCQEIVSDKFKKPLAHEHRALREYIKPLIKSNQVLVPIRRSELKIYPASKITSVGGSHQVLFFEEANRIDKKMFEDLVFAVRAVKQELRKIVIASTPGEECGWFHDLVKSVMENPEEFDRIRLVKPVPEDHSKDKKHPDQLFYQLHKAGAISDVAMEQNLHNRFMSRGDRLVEPIVVRAAVDRKLLKERLLPEPDTDYLTFGFTDTSRKKDITSLVLVELVNEEKKQTRCATIFEWDPADYDHGRVDMREVIDRIDEILKHWPIHSILIDDTDGSGSEILRHFAHVPEIEEFHFKRFGNAIFWNPLVTALYDQTLKIPDDERLIEELLTLRKQRTNDGRFKIVEENRDALHIDKSVSLAGCLWSIDQYLAIGDPQVTNLSNLFKKVNTGYVM